jgi:hypothetical protein
LGSSAAKATLDRRAKVSAASLEWRFMAERFQLDAKS